MTKFTLAYKDSYPFSDQSYQIGLNANTAVSITIPGSSGDRYRVQFSWPYNANVYVGYNVVPIVAPPNAVTSSSNVEFRPGFDGSGRYVHGGDILSFISLNAVSDCGFSLLKVLGQS